MEAVIEDKKPLQLVAMVFLIYKVIFKVLCVMKKCFPDKVAIYDELGQIRKFRRMRCLRSLDWGRDVKTYISFCLQLNDERIFLY